KAQIASVFASENEFFIQFFLNNLTRKYYQPDFPNTKKIKILKLQQKEKKMKVMLAVETQDGSITYSNDDFAVSLSIHVVREEMQDSDPTRHLHPRLDLHGGPDPDPSPTAAAGERGPQDANRLRSRQREGLDGEGGGHVLGPSGIDLSGGDEHKPDLAAGVEELEGAVVVGEVGPVGVSDGDVLGEGEADGGVREGEGGELDSDNGDLGVVGLEDSEVDDKNDDDDKDQENSGDYARSKICTAGGRSLGLAHSSRSTRIRG
ncbi:hypothetical protein F2P56_020406, partial [Juglans regia]